MIRSDAHGALSIPITTLDPHLHQDRRRRRRTVRRKEEVMRTLEPLGNPGNNTHADTTNNNAVGGKTTYLSLGQVLGRRTDGIDSPGITWRRLEDEATDI